MVNGRMKVTCGSCKRRVRVRPGTPFNCRCGSVLDPLPEHKLKLQFSNFDYDCIPYFRDRFFNGTTVEEKKEMVGFLLERATDEHTKKLALLTSIEVLRMVEGASFEGLASRIVAHWPRSHTTRYMLANCLDLSERREDHYEALKQRIVGTTLKCQLMRKEGELVPETFSKVLTGHLDRLYQEKKFLDGIERYPSTRSMLILKHMTRIEQGLAEHIRMLEGIGDIARLRVPFRKASDVYCVLDTNAISEREASRNFGDPRIRFVIPPEVLYEIAKWTEVDHVPLELEHVEVKEVDMNIPPEIGGMRCRKRGKVPSIADKKVATLAIGTRAKAIVTADADLCDSGLHYILEKQFGLSLDIVHPRDLGKWIERNAAPNDA